MARGYKRNTWLLLLLLVIGLIIGGFLGELLGNYIPVLEYGYNIGVTPHTWNLGIIQLTFGLEFKLNIFSILGIVAAVLVYREM